jgi:hypothetical protein
VFDPYLLHFSAPNCLESPRRVMIYTYSPAALGDQKGRDLGIMQ